MLRPRPTAFLAGLLLLLALPGAYGQKPPLTLDDVFNAVDTRSVQISPDGHAVAIEAARADWTVQQFRHDLWLYRDDNSGSLIQLTQSGHDSSATAPSPQSPALTSGYRILFDSSRQKRCGAEIYVMDPDGSHQRRLTHTPGKGKYCLGARWSPDRGKIAFDSDRDGNWEIFVMDADGSNLRRLTQTTGEVKMTTDMNSGCAFSAGGDIGPAWSPDGRKIVFDSDRDGKDEIYVMDADGSNVRRLTQTPGKGTGSGNPDWSPDGKKIALVSGPKDWTEDQIYVMDADGSHVQQLTNTPGRHNWTPRWSPDGKRIVFSSNRDGDPKNENSGEIYVMNADGSDVRRLTRYGFGAFRPSWSPDGKRIVFASTHHAKSTDDKDFEIYVMDADGTNVQRLTFNRVAGHPGW